MQQLVIKKKKTIDLKVGVTKKADVKSDDEFIPWLYGGPGCSPQESSFNENGPFRVDDDLNYMQEFIVVQYNYPTSKPQQSHYLFVPQPFGVGLSQIIYLQPV